jgi:hypothetical protein
MRLDDLALHGLAEFPPGQWPELARRWLTDGFDSPPLRDFAALDPWEAEQLADLMADVLQSLGVVLEAADTEAFEARVFELSGFAARCRAAVSVVQTDLDRTGYDRFRMHPVNVTIDPGWAPAACAALPDGACGSEENNPMTADMDDATLISYAAQTTCDTLLHVAHTRWPRGRCHPRRYLIPGPDPEPVSETEARAWWWCNAADDHPVAPIGGLHDIA